MDINIAALAKLARVEVSAEELAKPEKDGLTRNEVAGVKKAQKDVRAGKYASDKKVNSFFSRFSA